MAASNLNAFVVLQGLLKLLPQIVEEAVHLLGRFQIRRLDEFCRFDDPLLLDHRKRRLKFPRAVVFGFHLLCQLTKELLDAPLRGIELLHRFTLSLGDVGEAFFLLYLFTQGFERFETCCPQAGFALDHRQVPVKRAPKSSPH
jgi:hypothetical protein